MELQTNQATVQCSCDDHCDRGNVYGDHHYQGHLQGNRRVLTLNVLLLGDAQSGRSTAANALIGGREFRTGACRSGRHVTLECRLRCRTFRTFFRRKGEESDLSLRVMDTPPPREERREGRMERETREERVIVQLRGQGKEGADERRRKEERGSEITEAVREGFSEGVHILLLCVRADAPFQNTLLAQTSQALLGADWARHTLLVLTHADKLKEAGLRRSEYLTQASDSLRSLIDAVGGGFLFLDNTADWPEIEGEPMRDRVLTLSAQNHHNALRLQR